MIDSFMGKYRFLSNFWEAPVVFEGQMYDNNEAAFQAAKVIDKEQRKQFAHLNPSEAKRLGRRVKLRSDWEEVKNDVMYAIVKDKFTRNLELREKLVATGDEPLEEGNTWGDRIWGTVNGVGENRLGKILMDVRKHLSSMKQK